MRLAQVRAFLAAGSLYDVVARSSYVGAPEAPCALVFSSGPTVARGDRIADRCRAGRPGRGRSPVTGGSDVLDGETQPGSWATQTSAGQTQVVLSAER
jgi:hypothetical protein